MLKTGGLLLIGLVMCAPLAAQISAKPLIEDVGVVEKLGENVDLNLIFTNRDGKEVSLDDLVGDGKPTMLVPMYYSCPGLCTAVLDTLTNLVKKMELQLGVDYNIVNVSFDPTNKPELAKSKAENYRSMLNEADRRAANLAWYYLTGTEENITTLMNQIGFHYKFINGQYSHVATLVLLSPDGKITRYLNGVGMNPRDAKLALVEASGGKVGTPLDRALSYCFRYDPLAGKYVPWAMRIMRIGGLLTLLVMGTGGYFLWKSEFRKKRRLEHNV